MSLSKVIIDNENAFKILNNLPTAIIVVDSLGIILFSNIRAEEILNINSKEIELKLLDSVLIPFSTMREIAKKDSDSGISNRCMVRIGNDIEMTIGYSLSEVELSDNNTAFIISFQNIEKIKNLEIEKNQLLQQSAIHNTLHSILHEVKNPIAAITSIVELAIEDLDGVNIKSRLAWAIGLCDKVIENAKNSFIDKRIKFDVSQIKHLNSKLDIFLDEYKKTDLEKALKATFSECKRVNLILEGISCIGEKLIGNKYISVEQSLKEALLILNALAVQSQVTLIDIIDPMPFLPINNSVIRSIIFNLVINSIRFSKPRGIIEVISNYNSNDNLFCLSVKDSGIGMSEEVKKHALELFYTTHEKGSGIGLALVAEFVNGAGGNIDIISSPNKGTEINISIPNIKHL